jgi:hypothetical protein
VRNEEQTSNLLHYLNFLFHPTHNANECHVLIKFMQPSLKICILLLQVQFLKENSCLFHHHVAQNRNMTNPMKCGPSNNILLQLTTFSSFRILGIATLFLLLLPVQNFRISCASLLHTNLMTQHPMTWLVWWLVWCLWWRAGTDIATASSWREE